MLRFNPCVLRNNPNDYHLERQLFATVKKTIARTAQDTRTVGLWAGCFDWPDPAPQRTQGPSIG